jgi:hypothetical protein
MSVKKAMPSPSPVVDVACPSHGQAKSTKPGASKAKKTPENGKIVAVSKPSEAITEEAFGLRRVSCLLPVEVANEFEERGGAAWLTMVLRAGETVEPSQNPVVLPVCSENGITLQAQPAKALTDICAVRGVVDPTLEPTYNRRRAYRD